MYLGCPGGFRIRRVHHIAVPLRVSVRPFLSKEKKKKICARKKKKYIDCNVIIDSGLVDKCLWFFVVQFARQSYDVVGV